VKFLLECGVDVNIRNGKGETSLDLASGRGEVDVVRSLVENGADINAEDDIGEEKREYAQRLFRCLTVSIRPLRVEELAEVLAVQFDEAESPTFNADWRPENPEEMLMSVCSSLIAIVDRGGHQVIQFSHFSIKEYLTCERLATAEGRLSYFHILPEPAHTLLARASLTALLQLDDEIDRDTIGHFPLALYAARYWVNHARFRDVASHIQKAMVDLFNPASPHFVAWVWLHDIDHYWVEPMSTIHPTQPGAVPVYYASLCGFRGLVEHLISSHSGDVNSRGGSHTTPLHAAAVKGDLDVAKVAHMSTLVTLWAGFPFIGCHRAVSW